LVFKRRDRRGPMQRLRDVIYPRGGWRRAASYIGYRLRRLPDPPARIARGVAAGVFVCFSPFFGLHFVYAAFVAWLIRGNIVAALLATLVGNPLTFPAIAAVSIALGEVILSVETQVPLRDVFRAFSDAFGEFMANLARVATGEPASWARLRVFFEGVFLPYFIGGLLPGAVVSTAVYFLVKPVIEAYQARRARLLANRPKLPRRASSRPNAS